MALGRREDAADDLLSAADAGEEGERPEVEEEPARAEHA